MSRVTNLIEKLRGLHRVVKLVFLVVAVWALVMGAAHPIAALGVALPAAVLFVLATRTPKVTPTLPEEIPHETP